MSIPQKWSIEEEHLLRLLRPTNNFQEIENEFYKRFCKRIPGFYCLRSTDAIRRKCDRDQLSTENCKDYASSNDISSHWESIREIQEKYSNDCVVRRRGILDPKSITTKILSLSDIHFPMARSDFLLEAVNEHPDTDIVVLNGDILDGYIFSTFEKSRRIAALDEYTCAFEFIKYLSENFPKVVLTEGNHDDRAARALRSLDLPKEATQILRPNLIARIANGERLDSTGLLVEKLDFNNVIFQPNESWYVKIGKALFVHPSNNGGSKPGHMVNQWYEKFMQRYLPDEFDCIVIGHCHKLYKGIVNSTLLIEQGCLEGFSGYAWSPRNFYKNNAQNGYAVIYQDRDGNTCFNKSNIIYLGEVLPPKKSAI